MHGVVLIVDDDTYTLSIAKKILEKDHDVICVTSGKLALTVLKRRSPDIILLDVLMPEMDGFEVIEEIRTIPSAINIPIIFLTADCNSDTEVKCLEMGAADYIVKPFKPAVLCSRVSRCIELEQLRRNLSGIVEVKTKELDELRYEFTREIADIVEGRDNSTGGHVQRTSAYVELIVNKLIAEGVYLETLTESFADKLIHAASLHDIGKISISDATLNKPARLTPEEFNSMKLHVTYGGEMVERLMRRSADAEYCRITRNLVRYHHERWDGTGYIKGLKGEEIPLEARIMAVADVYDALVSKRCYKEPFSVDEAFDIIGKAAGTQFDPSIADVFLKLRDEFEAATA